MPPPRNVLLILTDEQRFDAVGFNGNPIVRTPHLDALAARSVNFINHSCSSPVCTPARASLLTGQYARTHGAPHVGHTLPADSPTLATWLAGAGFTCGLFGKSHLEPETSGFAERLKPTDPYYGFARTGISEDNLIGPYLEWIRAEHPDQESAAWTQANEACQAALRESFAPGRAPLEEAFPSPLPFELSQSLWITRQTEAFIRDETAARRPFFAVCSYVPPHHPWTPPEPYASLYRPADMPVPQRLPADYQSPWPLSTYNHRPWLPASELQRSIALYYALCTMVDDCIGQLLRTLAECGATDDTLIVFTSDHGDYNGDFGLLRKLGPLWDCLLRVPLLVHVPGHAANGSQRHALTQHEDLAPTILDLLGRPRPEGWLPGQPFAPTWPHQSLGGHVDAGAFRGPPRKESWMQGQSFAAALADPAAAGRRYSFFEQLCQQPGAPWVCGVADSEYKLLHYSTVGDVLVRPAEDRLEAHNLAGDPLHQPRRQELQQALYQWLLTTPCHQTRQTLWW